MRSWLTFTLILCVAAPGFAQAQSNRLMESASRDVKALPTTAHTSASQTPIPQPSWVARHPTLTGTLIGLGVGVPIGAATCKYPGAEGSSCAYYTYPSNARLLGGLTIGLVGAGIGAGVGTLIGALRR